MNNQLKKIPYNFEPRPYQLPFLNAIEQSILGKSDKRYFMQIWHRRSGKDKTNIADVAPKKLINDPCLVKYVYPTLTMGRSNLWDGIDGGGFKYMEHIPEFIRTTKPNETLMKMGVKPLLDPRYATDNTLESLFQIGGSDNPDSLRGGNPKMFIFSEWSEQDPYAWDVVEPILKENDGIAVFNFTPRGNNHARSLYEYAKNHPKWYVELLTARDTGVFDDRKLDEILRDIISRFAADGRSESEAVAYFEQEYMCSFKSPVVGSYYGDAIRKAEEEGRITSVPRYGEYLVDTYWDLGMDDSMTIWFVQNVGNEIHLVDYYENSGEGLSHYVSKLSEKGYVYGKHYAPFDVAVRELGTGKSRWESARELGLNFQVAPKLSIEDGINATRAILSRCYFDSVRCERGLNCLKNYKKDWDEKNKVFKNNPKHDWASHGSDAMRVFAVSHQPNKTTIDRAVENSTDEDPYDY